MLRDAEIRLSQGQKVGEICRGFGLSEQSYYRWRHEYGGIKVIQAHRLEERKNTRLGKAVSDRTLDKLILNEAMTGKYWGLRTITLMR